MEKIIIGITGRVGVGKTFLVDAYKRKYKETIIFDLDKEGHQCLTLPDIKHKLTINFGDKIFDSNNEIDRKALGNIVFNSQSLLNQLNLIIHPKIKLQVERKLKNVKTGFVIIVGALIKDIGLADSCHEMVAVVTQSNKRSKMIGLKKKIEMYQLSDLEYKSQSSRTFENTFNKFAVDKFCDFIQNLITFQRSS